MVSVSVDGWQDDAAFGPIRTAIIARTGMAYYWDRDDALARIVGTRIKALGLSDCAAYLRHLSQEAKSAEWEALIDEVTIGETYFFREPAQLDVLRDALIPDCMTQRGSDRRLRVWSAGCASGPEPYSVSILVQEALGHALAEWEISIVGTDISRGKLARAVAGRFKDWELRQIPEHYKRECFDRVDEFWSIKDKYKSNVSFDYKNLVEISNNDCSGAEAEFDIIMCRNVMIYFDQSTTLQVISGLHERLRPGGWLLVGHAEPHLQVAQVFIPQTVNGLTFYRKRPAPVEPSSETASPSPSRLNMVNAVPAVSALPAVGLPPARRPIANTQSRSTRPRPIPVPDGLPIEPAIASPKERTASEEALALARRHANGGEWQNAIDVCKRILDVAPLDADAHYLFGLILLHTGQASEAKHALKKAIYVDRTFALAHYHLGRILASEGDRTAALRSLRSATGVLNGADDTSLIRGGEALTVAEIRRLIDQQTKSIAEGA